jgi:hypothetical protein
MLTTTMAAFCSTLLFEDDSGPLTAVCTIGCWHLLKKANVCNSFFNDYLLIRSLKHFV